MFREVMSKTEKAQPKPNNTEKKTDSSDSTFNKNLINRIAASIKRVKADAICCLPTNPWGISVFEKAAKASNVPLASFLASDFSPMGDFKGKRILLCCDFHGMWTPNLVSIAKQLVNAGAAWADCLAIARPCWRLEQHDTPEECQEQPPVSMKQDLELAPSIGQYYKANTTQSKQSVKQHSPQKSKVLLGQGLFRPNTRILEQD